MENIFRFLFISLIIGGIGLSSQSFTVDASKPIPAPQGMQIKLTNADALDGAGEWVWDSGIQGYRWVWNSGRQVKIVFFGSRYSDGQDVTDPNCPVVITDYGETQYTTMDNFYYQDGNVTIYSRESSTDSWIYQGDMNMTSSNCTMDGSKVTMFTVNCNYLDNP